MQQPQDFFARISANLSRISTSLSTSVTIPVIKLRNAPANVSQGIQSGASPFASIPGGSRVAKYVHRNVAARMKQPAMMTGRRTRHLESSQLFLIYVLTTLAPNTVVAATVQDSFGTAEIKLEDAYRHNSPDGTQSFYFVYKSRSSNWPVVPDTRHHGLTRRSQTTVKYEA